MRIATTKSPGSCGNRDSWVKQIKLSLHVEMLHCDKTHKREIKKQADGDYNAHSCFGSFETVGVRPPLFNFHSSLLLALLVPNANHFPLSPEAESVRFHAARVTKVGST
jgi:hypothetical protein